MVNPFGVFGKPLPQINCCVRECGEILLFKNSDMIRYVMSFECRNGHKEYFAHKEIEEIAFRLSEPGE